MIMATENSLLFVISLSVSLSFLFPFGSSAITCNPIYIFGDEVYDTGNTLFIQADKDVPSHRLPYGITHFQAPTGRFSDGRLIPDWIAKEMNQPFFQPALNYSKADMSYGANFAVFQAKVLRTDGNYTMNFVKQVGNYDALVSNKSEAQRAVYLINIGFNDYLSFISFNPQPSEVAMQEFVFLVIGEMENLVEKIYDKGGRKIMFQNIGPIGCFPAMKQSYNIMDEGCTGVPAVLATLHNKELRKAAEEIQSRLPGLSCSIFDYHKAITTIISNFSAYGFKSADVACCGKGSHRGISCGAEDEDYELCPDPSKHIFFDGWHHTENINELMAIHIWNGSTDIVAPNNLKQLLASVPGSGNNISPTKFGHSNVKKLQLQA